MDYIFYILFILFVVWVVYRQFMPIKGLRNLTGQQFREEYRRDKGNLLVDVREVHEYKRGHIKGAVNIPLSQLKQRMNEIPKERHIYLYCQSGIRSRQAAKLLSRNGYTDLAHLRGGILSWNGPLTK